MRALTVILSDSEFLAALEAGRARAAWEKKGYVAEELTSEEPQPIFIALDTPSMFGDGRLVIVRGPGAPLEKEAERLAAWAASPPPGMAAILVLGRSMKLKKALGRHAEVIELAMPKPWETADWLVKFLKARARTITREAAAAVVDALGTDLRELANAAEQLTLATTGTIGVDTATRMFRGLDSQLYTFLDAILQRDRAASLKHLGALMGSGEYHPLVLAATLAKQFKAIAGAKDAGRMPAAALAKELDVSVGYVNRAYKHGANFSPDEVRRAFRLIADADDTLKGGERGNELPEPILMELLVAELTGDRPVAAGRRR
jgi:DNA polymerase-3 subunit delta